MDDAAPPADPMPPEEAPLLESLPYAGPGTPPPATPLAEVPPESGADPTLVGSPATRMMPPAAPPEPELELPGSRNLPDATDLRPSTPPAAPPVTVVMPRPEDEERIRERVSREDLDRLMAEVGQLYTRVESELASSPYQSAEVLGWLHEARTILMARPQNYPLAELRLNQTRLRLRQVAESQQAAGRVRGRLIGWNLFFMLFFGTLLAIDWTLTRTLVARGLLLPPRLPNMGEPTLSWFFPPWLCLLMGGIGGALSALYVLQYVIRRREYDPDALWSYLLQPLTGAFLGAVTYYLLLTGFLAATVSTTFQIDPFDLATQIQIARSPLFLLVAFSAGVAQQSFWNLIRRFWRSTTNSEEERQQREPIALEPVPVESAPPTQGDGASPPPIPPG